MNRLSAAVLAALAILLLIAAPVGAGGWATVTPDEGTPEPRAGEPVDLGFTLLQHGETPAPWASASVVASNALTGETVRAVAASTGADGHFTASLTVPEAGLWTWRVEIADLESASTAFPLPVRTAHGALPAVDAATVLQLVEQAKSDMQVELGSEYQARLEDLERQVATRGGETRALSNRLDAAIADREALQARIDGLPASGDATLAAGDGATLPVVGLIAIAVLAGAAAGFVMTMLARPGRVSTVPVEDSPQPEYALTR